MSSASESSASEPSSPVSTPPSSVPSPQIASLSLDPVHVSEEDKAEALKLKAEANKAFSSEFLPTAALLLFFTNEYGMKAMTFQLPHDCTLNL